MVINYICVKSLLFFHNEMYAESFPLLTDGGCSDSRLDIMQFGMGIAQVNSNFNTWTCKSCHG